MTQIEPKPSGRHDPSTRESEVPEAKPLEFWAWFAADRSGQPGWRRLIDKWIVLHGAVGIVVANAVQLNVTDAARATLLPLAGVFVGMSFAWVGSAQAISQSIEVDKLAKRNPAGFESYVYPFQLAILGMLVALGAWGLGALGLFDQRCLWRCPGWSYTAVESELYGLASLVFRLCWQVVLGSQMLLLYQRAVSKTTDSHRAPDV